MTEEKDGLRRPAAIWYIGVGLVVWIGALILMWRPPVYLAPPLFVYSPALYLLLALAGFIAFLVGLLRATRRHSLVMLVMVLSMIGQCCVAAALLPAELGALQLALAPIGMPAYQRCEEGTNGSVACDICFTSSDSPSEIVTHYEFRRLGPLLWLRSRSTTDANASFPCEAYQ